MNTVDVRQSLTYNTRRLLSPSVWGDCRVRDYLENPSLGAFFGTDFVQDGGHASTAGGTVTEPHGIFSAFLSQGASIANPTSGELGGAVELSSDGDDEGVALVSKVGSILIATRTGSGCRKAWFETRLKVSTIADTKFDLFAGLFEGVTPTATVPITATGGTMADKNFIGFQRNATDGDQIDFTYKADGQTVQLPTGLTDIITVANSGVLGLVADTYVKLGFRYDRDAEAANRIQIFVNEMKLSTFITETMIAAVTFPSDMALGLALAVLNATGTTPGKATCDFIFAGVEY